MATYNILYLVSTKFQAGKIKKALEKENEFFKLLKPEDDIKQNLSLLEYISFNSNLPSEIILTLKQKFKFMIEEKLKSLEKINQNLIFYFDISKAIKEKDIREIDSLKFLNPNLERYFSFDLKRKENITENNVYIDSYEDSYDDEEENLVDESNHDKFPLDLPQTIIIVLDNKLKDSFIEILKKAKINQITNQIEFYTSFDLTPSILGKKAAIFE